MKKKVIWAIVSLLLAFLSIIAVIGQADSISIEELIGDVKNANPFWLTMAICAMLGFIVFEGEAIRSILKHVGYKRHHLDGFVYAAADVYFSAITPSASGGQPASAYFMMRSAVPASVATATLILNLIMYTLSIVTVGAICAILAPNLFLNFNIISRLLIIFGYSIIIIFASSFCLLLFKRSLLEAIIKKIFRFLSHLKLLKNVDEKIEKLEVTMDQYKSCVDEMRKHKRVFISSYLFNLAQRLSQLLVPVFLYLAAGGEKTKAFDVYAVQTYVSIGANCMPVPGGMGVTDYLMIDGFRGLLENDFAVKLELMSRSLSFYICVLISFITVIIGYSFCKRKANKGE